MKNLKSHRFLRQMSQKEEVLESRSATMSHVKQFLTELHANSPIFPNDAATRPATILNTKSAREAIHKLLHSNLTALPVVDAAVGTPTCVLLLPHVLLAIISKVDPKKVGLPLKADEAVLALALDHGMFDKPVDEFVREMNKLWRHRMGDQCIVKSSHATVLDAMRQLVERRSTHAIVIGDKSEVENVIAASRLCELLAACFEHSVVGKQILSTRLELFPPKIWTATKSMTALKAFELMLEKKVSALPVVDAKGALCGTISLSDIRLLDDDHGRYFGLIKGSVDDYVQLVHGEAPRRGAIERPSVICVKDSDTFGDVLAMLNFYRVHRVWIVDNDRKPIGCVSAIDVLASTVEAIDGTVTDRAGSWDVQSDDEN